MNERWPRAAAYWVGPMALCLLVHWLSFRAWFRADDFAWLGLASHIHNANDWAVALFAPMAQGTIRTLSERLFFIGGFDLFGLHSLPYRLVIFATQFAALAIMMAIAGRITARRAVGPVAAALWMLNSATVQPLGWACVYNEVLCAFFLLLALYARMRGWRVLEWAAFLLGFGALEINVVYPAIALAYALCFDKSHWRSTLPMFAVSAAYTVVHGVVAPAPQTGPYAMHFGGSILRTLVVYWTWTLGPVFNSTGPHITRWMLGCAIAAMSLTLAAFAWRNRRGAMFCAAWFAITIAPLLPLRDHLTEYYPYLPSIGFCWLGGWALVEAWRSGALWQRAAAVALAVTYCVLMMPQLRALEKSGYAVSRRTEALIAGVAEVHRRDPDRAVVLAGMDAQLVWAAMESRGFDVAGIPRVYLAEGSPANGGEFVLPTSVAAGALVYDARTLRIAAARELRGSRLPVRVDAADPLYAPLLGPEWYASEGGHRWMPQRATLRMGAPEGTARKLYLTGNCPAEELANGPVMLAVTLNGVRTGVARIERTDFEVAVDVPDAVGAEMRVEMAVDRVFHSPDGRDLGLAFGLLAADARR